MTTLLFDTMMQPYFPSKSMECSCVGNLAECEVLIDHYGALHTRWSSRPQLSPTIEALWLMPTTKQMQACHYTIPAALQACSQLTFLYIPLAMLSQLHKNDLPSSLQHLQIVNMDMDYPATKVNWELLRDMTNLQSVVIHNDFGSPDCASLLEGIEVIFPRLRYLSYDVRKNSNLIARAPEALSHLNILVVEGVGEEYNIQLLPVHLRALAIIGATRDFDLRPLVALQQLESLRLNGIKGIIDVDIFAQMKQLRDLFIINSKKWHHPERLAELTLDHLTLIDCGKPLKKFKSLFHEQAYDTLDIEFS